jgi:hypothetical protein
VVRKKAKAGKKRGKQKRPGHATGPKGVRWPLARELYQTSDLTMAQVAEILGVRSRHVYERAAREGWVQGRKNFREQVAAEYRKQTMDETAQVIGRVAHENLLVLEQQTRTALLAVQRIQKDLAADPDARMSQQDVERAARTLNLTLQNICKLTGQPDVRVQQETTHKVVPPTWAEVQRRHAAVMALPTYEERMRAFEEGTHGCSDEELLGVEERGRGEAE